MDLTINDYKSILLYYDINYKKMSNKKIKISAENILANKLCRCIKKVKKKQNKPIGICKNSVINKKNLKIGRFTCKKKAKIIRNKKTRKMITKTKKTIIKSKRKSKNKSKNKSKIKSMKSKN
uniref:Uncharacterized protein n=1 Tax=viral metagenome TaxID=1070528 RepID=A0A6C0JBY5_9ZZZZ